MDFAAFHFLRPEWLLALVAAAALPWLAARRGGDPSSRWGGTIAAHLLPHLLVGGAAQRRWRPVHLTAVLIALGAIALAGPTWQRERSPFVEDQAPLAIALDLSPTMDAIDISPTRLERAKLKVRDLLALRPGARTALFAYAGSAHMVLPLTSDTNLIQTYVDSLSTAIMPVPGKNSAKALAVVDAALAREDTPGTILFVTDGVEPGATPAFKSHAGKNEIMVLGIGTAEGGPVKTGADEFLTDASGQRVFAKLDAAALRALAADAGAEVATVTADDSDVRWIQRRMRTHLAQQQVDGSARWRDFGWYLTWPIALLGALWFRRGWTIRWAGVFMVGALLLPSSRAGAADWRFADLWLTADQQGQLAYERGDYATAAERFADPMWKGVACYRAGRYDEAIEVFARLDTAESHYNEGNALARLGKLQAAVASYDAALELRPEFAAAQANRSLVQKLIQTQNKDDEQAAQEPTEKADEIQFDDKAKKGKVGQVEARRETAEMWMRNIQTTPAQLLQRKFALEVQQEK